MTGFVSIGVLLAAIIAPFAVFAAGRRDKARFKRCLAVNVAGFFATLLISTAFVFGGAVYAAEPAGAPISDFARGLAFVGAALSTGLGSIGAGVATGQAASAALGALSENEGIMGKALIFVALAEGVAIYGLLISIMILGRV
jgi:V/A-type H+-transporting ATPase subunit K